MKKIYIISIGIIFTIVILLGGYFIYSKTSAKIPHNAPKIIIKYNKKNVQTSLSLKFWINNNYDNGSDYNNLHDLGLNTPQFNAKSGDKIHILIPKNPVNVWINQIESSEKIKNYLPSKEGKEYIYTLPTKKGVYIFEVLAKWDINHCIGNIFRVNIE